MTRAGHLPPSYLQKLGARTAVTGSVLCLGIDPDPDALPAGFPCTVEGIERFANLLVEAAGPFATAIKPNIAFFEAWGSDGIAVLERLRRAVPDDVPLIIDAKRGDIASTSARGAVALFDVLGADAVTVNPYLGRDAVEPYLARGDGFAYVLCRTSNAGAGEFQDASVDGEPLYLRVARTVATWAEEGTIGLVVGATAPEELRQVRRAAPSMPFLVPGVGAQGGSESTVLADGPASAGPAEGSPGGALLVNVSRGIAAAAIGAADPGQAIADAAQGWSARLRVLA